MQAIPKKRTAQIIINKGWSAEFDDSSLSGNWNHIGLETLVFSLSVECRLQLLFADAHWWDSLQLLYWNGNKRGCSGIIKEDFTFIQDVEVEGSAMAPRNVWITCFIFISVESWLSADHLKWKLKVMLMSLGSAWLSLSSSASLSSTELLSSSEVGRDRFKPLLFDCLVIPGFVVTGAEFES